MQIAKNKDEEDGRMEKASGCRAVEEGSIDSE